MFLKRILIVSSLVLSMMLYFADFAVAQMNPLYKFKGVNIPVSLKIKDNVLEKGVYDLEFLRTGSPVLYYLKIWQRGKALHVLQGEEWVYGSGIVSDIATNPNIPGKPTLKMTRNPGAKLLTIVFETGRNHGDYPMLRARFKFQYQD
jgi:hypothetical protein